MSTKIKIHNAAFKILTPALLVALSVQIALSFINLFDYSDYSPTKTMDNIQTYKAPGPLQKVKKTIGINIKVPLSGRPRKVDTSLVKNLIRRNKLSNKNALFYESLK